MVSFKLRRIFYTVAASTEEVLEKKRQTLNKLDEIESQLKLAKKLLKNVEKEKTYDAATIIRMEGKLKKLEQIINQQRNLLSM